jgi:energy-coupling factor transport system permease protein
MTVWLLYVIVAAVGVSLAMIAYLANRGQGKLFVGFTLLEIVIMAIIGVINGVLGTPNAMLGRLFMTFSGSYGFLAFAAICGGFYV